ncbi:MAG: hypothetical protein ACK5X8_16195, partial [Planctomyces sp.]
LWQLHCDERQWYVRQARRELARRLAVSGLSEDLRELRERLRQASLTAAEESLALESLWSLPVHGGFYEVKAT